MYAKVLYISFALVVATGGSAAAWTGVTVGDALPLGSESFDPATGIWTIEADGHDIWDNADDFHYVYKYLVGDGVISARVLEWGPGSNAWAKAGVMMRETLAGGSVHAMTVITAGEGGGGGFQRRPVTDGGSASDHDPSPNVGPGWFVRVERTGDEFRGYFSQDGVNWWQQGPAVTIPMRTTAGLKAGCFVGLCVTSHATGELRTVTLDSVALEGEIYDAEPPQVEAYEPVPADGATGVVVPLLQWTAGQTALWHRIYLGTSPELTEADIVAPQHPMPLYFHIPGLTPGATYWWRVDEIEPLGTTHTGPVWHFTTAPLTAFNPMPPDEAKFQEIDVDLTWASGANAMSHDVYLSTSAEDVIAGAPTAFQGSLTDTMFDPGTLALDTTYFWRVDETDVIGAKHIGDVWAFTTTVPGLGSIKREIWESIDGTSLSDLRADSRFPWLPTYVDELTAFDSPEYGDNYGGRLEAWLHVPLTGEYTFWVAGDDNTELYLGAGPGTAQLIADIPSWTGARAWDTMPSQKSPPIHLEAGRHYIAALWKEGGGGDHCAAAWQGPGAPERTVIPGSFLKPFEAVWAYDPQPADGAVDVPQMPALQWATGVRAVRHDVYFGDDAEAVANADLGTAGVYQGRQPIDAVTYLPAELAWNKTYYWRIDEVNEAHPESPWKGAVWSFTTADFLVIDDFEGYTDDIDAGEAIWQTWIDGLTNNTGSIVGYFEAPFAEQTVVYAGRQSMPLDYNNLAAAEYSEVTRRWAAPQDWTANEVKALTLYFRGWPSAFMETAPGAIKMSAAGVDIWDIADEFRYAYRPLVGDGSIVARVDSLRDTDVWAKAGIMIRETLDVGSTFAAVYLTGSNGVRFQARPIGNDSATSDSAVATPEQVALVEPVWLKLERVGDAFNAYYSTDPDVEGWIAMAWNPQTIPMTGAVTIGLALTSHSAGNVTVAEFSEVSAQGAVAGSWQVAEIGGDHPANVPEPLYVGLEDSAGTARMVIHPDPEAVLLDSWQEWNIALSDFALAGVDLTRIMALHIGVGDGPGPHSGGRGLIYIDEIRGYKSRCVPAMAKPAGDLNNDCVVDTLDLELMAEQWLSLGTVDVPATADLNGDGRVNLSDYSGLGKDWLEEVLWP